MVNGKSEHNIDTILKEKAEVRELPLKWCSVKFSEVVRFGKRIDATMFDIELRQALSLINNSSFGTKFITGEDGLCSAYRPGICKRNFVEKSDKGIEMFTPSQVTDIYPKSEKYLSTNMKANIADWYVKENEILLSCSGTIGNATFVSKTLNGKCVSQNMIRLYSKDSSDTGYIYSFLKSKIGQLLLTRNNYGAVIQHIDPAHLSTVPIPNAPAAIKQKIHTLIVESYRLRDESNELIDEATKLLIEELHLPKINEFDVKRIKNDASVEAFNIKLSQLSGRADASYHVPIVAAMVEHLRKYAEVVITVGDSRISKEVVLPGRFKRVYVDEGYGRVLFGGKQISELDPSGKKYLSASKHDRRIIEELEIKENMTLITRSGTIGKVALVPKHWENWVASEHIIRVIPSNQNIAGYLNVFLSSEYGHELITRYTYGSVVDEIDDNHVRRIPIPLLKNKETQLKINELALKANQKRYEAYVLEQKALEIMDEEVIYAKETK